MYNAIFVLSLIVCGLIHILTGRSAFFWIARGAILVDASLTCAWRELLRAAATWWRSLPAVIREIKAEVAR